MASVRTVAKEAGVSPSTVSRILNAEVDVDPDTRARVLEVVNRLGYAPKVGRRITNVLGLTVPATVPRDLGSFDGATVAGCHRGALEEGFAIHLLSLAERKESRETWTQMFTRRGVRGVLLRMQQGYERVVEEIVAEGFAHVIIANRVEDERASWIDADSRPASEQAVRHLIDLGHRRIAIGVNPTGLADTADRLAGYRDALAAAGVPYDPTLVFDCPLEVGSGAQAVSRMLSMASPPTAFFATNPLPAVGALRRLAELGVDVPGSFSLIGFDEAEVRMAHHPRLAAVCQDAHDLAYRAARHLAARLRDDEPTEPMRVRLRARLELGETTGLAPSLGLRVLPDGRHVVIEGGGAAGGGSAAGC